MKYIKQLDSLRAIAVLLVVFSHWITLKSVNNIIDNSQIGAIGVDIFFVLSGFLITKILFENRIKAEGLKTPIAKLVKNFYVRRTLRIFPIYYLTIFLLLIFQKSTGTNIHSAFLYFATYTSNFYFFNIQSWDGMISHLWSLAVEEQFYLIWPWIILFINKKYFLHVIICFILIGLTSQYFLVGVKMSSVLTFTCFDAFGIGALLAWQIIFHPKNLNKFYLRVSVIASVAAALFILGVIQKQWIYLPLRTIVSLLSLWIITYIIINHENDKLKFKFIFNNRAMIFTGKISYGIYLYHNIIPGTLNSQIINKYLNPLFPDIIFKKHWQLLYLTENAILLIVISWISYKFIETPFLNLKKYFDYQDKKIYAPG